MAGTPLLSDAHAAHADSHSRTLTLHQNIGGEESVWEREEGSDEWKLVAKGEETGEHKWQRQAWLDLLTRQATPRPDPSPVMYDDGLLIFSDGSTAQVRSASGAGDVKQPSQMSNQGHL